MNKLQITNIIDQTIVSCPKNSRLSSLLDFDMLSPSSNLLKYNKLKKPQMSIIRSIKNDVIESKIIECEITRCLESCNFSGDFIIISGEMNKIIEDIYCPIVYGVYITDYNEYVNFTYNLMYILVDIFQCYILYCNARKLLNPNIKILNLQMKYIQNGLFYRDKMLYIFVKYFISQCLDYLKTHYCALYQMPFINYRNKYRDERNKLLSSSWSSYNIKPDDLNKIITEYI